MTPYLLNEGGWEHDVFDTLDLQAAYGLERTILEYRLAVEEAFIPACVMGGEVPDEKTKEWWIRKSAWTPSSVMVIFWTSMVAHDWREQLPRSPSLFKESGHSPFWEEPKKFNREVASITD